MPDPVITYNDTENRSFQQLKALIAEAIAIARERTQIPDPLAPPPTTYERTINPLAR